MSRKAVLLFSGQGAQKVGMGKDLAEAFPVAKSLLERADAALGFALTEVMFNGPMEDLTKTSRCQPALYAHGLAVLEVLKEKLPTLEITATAGLSLGEFTAHSAAGTFDFETGLKLVFQRGTFMEEACEQTKGAMAALIGGEESAVRELAAENGVDVANFNCPGQIVISGSVEGIDAAAAGAKDKGIKKAIKLPVAGAYHSKLMQSAQDKLSAVLAATDMHTPRVPVVCNFEARTVSGADEIRATLEKQVTGSVRWEASMRALIAEGHDLFIELGPDSALKNFMARIDKGITAVSIGDVASLEAALAVLQ
jgi:[acyl-carrier-protein] S-malonyltransferase